MSHATEPIAIKYGLYTNLVLVTCFTNSLLTVPGRTSGEDQPNKKRCIEDKDGDTGEGFSHYEGLLQVAPSTVFVGGTVQERVENCGTKATC